MTISPPTEAYDRGRKFENYEKLESLAEYLLVVCDHMHADLFTPQPDGRWIRSSTDKSNDASTLASIGGQLVLADIYEKVEW